jgi:NAD(P)-dependent dehydrogenase (short-subunit alcohol dehydrogenase family)
VDLGGQVALGTASGGVGIGRAVALALAEHGATVAVTNRSAERAAGVAEIRARGEDIDSDEVPDVVGQERAPSLGGW